MTHCDWCESKTNVKPIVSNKPIGHLNLCAVCQTCLKQPVAAGGGVTEIRSLYESRDWAKNIALVHWLVPHLMD